MRVSCFLFFVCFVPLTSMGAGYGYPGDYPGEEDGGIVVYDSSKGIFPSWSVDGEVGGFASSYLWSAALVALGNFPLRQVDSAGGVVLSEWQIDALDPLMRAKVDVAVVGHGLDVSDLRVSVFVERRANVTSSTWISVPDVSSKRSKKVMEAILKRARRYFAADYFYEES